MKERFGFYDKLKAYRLANNVYVVCVLAVITILSVVVYLIPSFRANEVVANIAIAVFTSLMASIVAILAEVYVQFKACERDRFLEDIHAFGIVNLNKNKEEALRTLLASCKREVWISGYRLIITEHLKEDVAHAVRTFGAKVKVLACPPWESAYKMIYGDDKVADNYFKVIHALLAAEEEYADADGRALVEVRFVDKPIFSDTYRIDHRLVSGPYMHNKDKENKKLTAKDFFSYNLEESPMYHLVDAEFRSLWEEAAAVVDTARFREAYRTYEKEDLTEAGKIELLRSAADRLSLEV